MVRHPQYETVYTGICVKMRAKPRLQSTPDIGCVSLAPGSSGTGCRARFERAKLYIESFYEIMII